MIRNAVLCSFLVCGALLAQNSSPNPGSNVSGAPKAQTTAASPKTVGPSAHFHPDPLGGHAGKYYRLIWGVDSLDVRSAESGEVIRFTYRVLDPGTAKTLSDKRLEPSLIDEKAHVKLIVPTMDKVGKLRQTTEPEPGKLYWMLFSNKGGYVKRGDRVNIVIGNFHANGLVVD
jgi:hypothetical protein